LANIKSSKKDIVRSRKNRTRNMSWKSRCKTLVRKTRTAISSGDPAVAAEMARQTSRQLDKAATKGVIHPRQAARRKARLIRRLNTMRSPGGEA
jgi:small subunit ribosomal protein S20